MYEYIIHKIFKEFFLVKLMWFLFCKTQNKRIDVSLNDRGDVSSVSELSSEMTNRLSTFECSWETRFNQDVKILAEAGFYYTGIADRVKCFCCGCTVEGWTKYDDPWQRHVIISPKCDFLRKNNIQLEVVVAPSILSLSSVCDLTRAKNDDRLCKICYEREYSTALLPCGHVIACNECSSLLKFCAVCRTFVDKRINVYF